MPSGEKGECVCAMACEAGGVLREKMCEMSLDDICEPGQRVSRRRRWSLLSPKGRLMAHSQTSKEADVAGVWTSRGQCVRSGQPGDGDATCLTGSSVGFTAQRRIPGTDPLSIWVHGLSTHILLACVAQGHRAL